jgi:hypothetical protein
MSGVTVVLLEDCVGIHANDKLLFTLPPRIAIQMGHTARYAGMYLLAEQEGMTEREAEALDQEIAARAHDLCDRTMGGDQ